MPYVDWEYYSSLYTDLEENQFYKYVQKASVKLDAKTHRRVGEFERNYCQDTATEFQKQVHMQIQNTMCELINAFHMQ